MVELWQSFWFIWKTDHSAIIAFGTAIVFWIGSAAYVFKYTKRSLERSGSRTKARLDPSSRSTHDGWHYDRDQGHFDSSWEFTSPRLFLFLIGGPIMAPFLAYAYHLWTNTNALARLRYWIHNCPAYLRGFIYKARTRPDGVITCDQEITFYADADVFEIEPKLANIGDCPIVVDGFTATLWRLGDPKPVLSWEKRLMVRLTPNHEPLNLDRFHLDLSNASTRHKDSLKEWIYSNGENAAVVFPGSDHSIPFKFSSLPSGFTLRIEFLNARWA